RAGGTEQQPGPYPDPAAAVGRQPRDDRHREPEQQELDDLHSRGRQLVKPTRRWAASAAIST
ncbi:MAG: hypothetical protein JWM15_1467, partial [Cryptosporangiaceae bacterium]|nr:hypothetical protein [Cryptosporangiaceae bacterium]